MTEQIPILGIALVLAFAAGKSAHYFRIPQVTAFILVGFILGPSVANLISKEMALQFSIINEIALGLILFNIGGEFHRGLLKKVTRLHVKHSVIMATILIMVVFSICLIFAYFTPELSWEHKLAFSAFLAFIATSSAPPTTLLVIKELNSKGPLTQSIMVHLAVGTIIALTGTHSMTFLFQDLGIWSGRESNILMHIFLLVWSLVGSLVVGSILGFLLSVWEQRERHESELLFACVVAILLGHTISYYIHLEPLLVSLFMGFALVNSSPEGQAIHARVKGMGLSIYALLFVIAGAHIHIQENLRTVGLLGLGYIFARTIGYLVSSRVAARLSGDDPHIAKKMSFSVLSHGSVALAIVSQIMSDPSSSAQSIVTVILSALFVFEMLGPLILRWILVHAGEVKMGSLLSGSSASLSYFELTQNLLTNLGIFKPHESHKVENIKLLVNRKVYAIENNANVREVIHFVDKHHLPIYPVVDKDYKFEGVISMADLQDVMFDPFHARLSYARRLIGNKICIGDGATLEEAIEVFNENDLEVLPVIDSQTEKLIGTLSYKDVVIALKGRQLPVEE